MANDLNAEQSRTGSTRSTVEPEGGSGKFPEAEVEVLRGDLLQSGLDSWQTAELISAFLSGRGYGVSRKAARSAVERIEEVGFTIESMQAELEKLAMVM